MPTNKSPGMDGLTVEFYRAFWDILGPYLATVWAESLQGGVLPLSCRRAVLTLLPKKGDFRNLRNWRPVSLLSTDYKIVAKAISLRLGSVMADVIHPDQTYTVPGRSIFDNLFLVRDLLELGRREGLSFALLSLYQEKAFDQVRGGHRGSRSPRGAPATQPPAPCAGGGVPLGAPEFGPGGSHESRRPPGLRPGRLAGSPDARSAHGALQTSYPPARTSGGEGRLDTRCSDLSQLSPARGRTPPTLYPKSAGPFNWAPTP
ncbi:unnamed protein product [Eretmochelys imbricata]